MIEQSGVDPQTTSPGRTAAGLCHVWDQLMLHYLADPSSTPVLGSGGHLTCLVLEDDQVWDLRATCRVPVRPTRRG